MPDLLLELFSEEIPARMQRQAGEDLKRLVTNALVERNLTYEGAQAFVTPRRLALHVVGLPSAQVHVARGAKRAPRRRAGGGDPGIFEERRPRPHRGRDHREGPEERRILRRRDREARPLDERGAGRDRAGDRARLPLAEVDALGQRPRSRTRRACAGCARCAESSAPSPRRTMRPRSCPSPSTASRPATSPGATASWRLSRSPSGASTTMSRPCGRPGSCSTPTGARPSSSRTPRPSPSRKG